MVIAVVNHYQLRVQVPLTILPVPRPRIMLYYTISLHHIDDNYFILELFHTKPPSVKISDNCGFRYTFHMFYFCTHNLLRVLDLSNLA